MAKENKKIEELREYSAINWMKWVPGSMVTVGREMSAYDEFVPNKKCKYSNRYTYYDTNDFRLASVAYGTRIRYEEWKPDQDRDQLNMLIEKLDSLHLENLRKNGICVGEKHLGLFESAMSEPTDTFIALVELHKKGEIL